VLVSAQPSVLSSAWASEQLTVLPSAPAKERM
jgi:hypothetical protein